jgi:hypothetical protein
MDLSAAKVEFHIEELVLHGFEGRDRAAIQAAIQQELSRLLTAQGIPLSWEQGGEVGAIDGGSFDLPAGAKSEFVGTQIAQSIYGGFSP